MLVAEKAHRTKSARKLISVSSDVAYDILKEVKKLDPNAHIVEPATSDEGFVSPEDQSWYTEIKKSWHPGISLRIRRENAGITQVMLAELTGIAVSNISAIENGHRPLGLAVARKFAQALNRPLADFIEAPKESGE
jgi:DNA-binding XRE family transcriptional regulator